MVYTVYLLLCSDGTFYTGITTDLPRRLKEHAGSKLGAKYTRTRQPVQLAYSEFQPDRSSAQKREHVIRTLSHFKKEQLMATYTLSNAATATKFPHQ